MTTPLDSLPRDISQSLRDALTEFHQEHGFIPPRRKWVILFGPEHEPANKNHGWMAL